MTQSPLNWIKHVHTALIEAQAIPLSGFPPPFPWEQLAEKIASQLHLTDLQLSQRKAEFVEAASCTVGLGMGFIAIAIDMPPLDGQCFWLMPKADVEKLTSLSLTSNGNKGFSTRQFQEGYYYYLATEAALAISELQAFQELSPKIGKWTEVSKEAALCIDVELKFPKYTLWGRLVCPASFHQSFKTHFSTLPPPSITHALAAELTLPLRMEVGETALPLRTFKELKVGDFLVLDRCTYDPKTQKGTITLFLEKKPLLRGRIKDAGLKITDYAFYQEEPVPMSPEKPQDEENIKESFDVEEISIPEEPSEENHLWSAGGEEKGVEKLISTEEIPLTISVEVARLRMNLDKLLQLSPGNVLELSVRPEQGVDLTIDGKKVAKGELIKLGEMLGVKILQLGE